VILSIPLYDVFVVRPNGLLSVAAAADHNGCQ